MVGLQTHSRSLTYPRSRPFMVSSYGDQRSYSLSSLVPKEMADTIVQVVVSPFLGVLFDNLGYLIQKEFGLVWGVHKEMERLSSTLSTIQAVLEDAEEKQLMNKAIGNWLRKLKDAAYDADDVLDDCAVEGLNLESEMISTSCSSKQITDTVLSCLNCKHTMLRLKIGKRIKELRDKFEEIASERSKFHLTDTVVNRSLGFCDRETSSKLKERQVHGREEDVANLVALLLRDWGNEEDISVCSVLGIGGLGKTTLAQMVYNHNSIEMHFEVKIWVSVTEDFDVRRLIKAIIVSLSGNVCELEELDALQNHLGEKLRGRSFLLVLDDVWNDNQDNWDKLMCSLRCGAKGSFVIVTTRLESVASITGTLPHYRLKLLCENDCWSVFKQHAFPLGSEERPNLVNIGKEIVKKCGGVPLAAKALGGFLRFSSEENKWLSVRDSEIWDIPESNENNILAVLRLSYNHLPSYLKQCFAYCSIFPKGHVIVKEELIHLWIANGLVQPQGRMESEDSGNDVLNALQWRSFFQDITEDEDGRIRTCKMHDLVHDLACHVAMDECSIMKGETITRRTRHLSVHFDKEQSSYTLSRIASSSPWLRSLVSVNSWSHKRNPQFDFSSLVCLRALSLRYAPISVLPKSIGKMKHLRYLNLSDTHIRSLPKSICGLRNLQTLKLKGCYRLQTFPKNMRNMCSLKHLDIQGCESLTETPSGIGQLTCLRTLSIFIVGLESGHGTEELQSLNLRGELEIKGIEHMKNSSDAKKANLMRKDDLCSLKLSWAHSHLQRNAEDVIEGLKPNSSIRRLFIKQYEGVTLPSWLGVSSLPNLVEISLFRCRRSEVLPPIGRLPLLKVLKIHSMISLKFITDEVYDQDMMERFPSLEELSLSMMPNLEGWSPRNVRSPVQGSGTERQGALFPCLRKLILEECPKLTRVTFSPSLHRIKLMKCNELVLESLHNLPFLSSLEISDVEPAFFFPSEMLGNLPALRKLDVRSCYNLKTLPVELSNLAMLTSLVIIQCTELISLPEGFRNLSSLKSLSIYECHGLKRLPDLEMHSLEDLDIYDCPELEFCMEDFQHLVHLRSLSLCMLLKLNRLPNGLIFATRLQSLSILGCSNLMELPEWIDCLTSLQTLHIEGCKNLKTLPEGLQNLTVLHHLEMVECDPKLEKRCEEDKGEDWHKISHVPYVLIRS